MENKAGQQWDPVEYEKHAGFSVSLVDAILERLDAKPGESILDLGCGDGALTQRIAATGCDVEGIDASAEQLVAASARGLKVRQTDAHALADVSRFDAVFSGATLHWMHDPTRVAANVYRALRPGGRFVAEQGGHGCVAAIRAALHEELSRHGSDGAKLEPWDFPTAELQRARLTSVGFAVDYAEVVARPTPLPTDMLGWLSTFSERFIQVLPMDQRSAALDRVVERLRPILCDESGTWTADYTRLRFVALKPR